MCEPGHIWDDYRPEDYLYARLGVFGRMVARARELVSAWLEQCGRPYIACSGGKDSVAMTHLIQTYRLSRDETLLPVMWHDSGVEWPGVEDVFVRLRAMGLVDDLVIVRPEHDVLDLKRRQLAGEISAHTKDKLALFDPIAAAIDSAGWDGAAIGLRKGESHGRLLNRCTHGNLYRTKDGLLRCTPLGDWDWQDVYAYIATHRLPLHPIYSAPLLGLEHRGRIRLSWWASTDNYRHGEISWVKANYPELFAQLCLALPGISAYA